MIKKYFNIGLEKQRGSINIMLKSFVLTSKTKGPPGFSLNKLRALCSTIA